MLVFEDLPYLPCQRALARAGFRAPRGSLGTPAAAGGAVVSGGFWATLGLSRGGWGQRRGLRPEG